MSADQGAAAEDGKKEKEEASKTSDGKNDAVQMNENVLIQPVIDKYLPFKTPVLAITSLYVGKYSRVVI